MWEIMREDLQENRECGMLGNLRDYKKAPSDLMGGTSHQLSLGTVVFLGAYLIFL